MRVLIVEDVYEVALELAENLSSASPSIDVDIRGSRSSGMAAIERHEFDFIVCDLRLPASSRRGTCDGRGPRARGALRG